MAKQNHDTVVRQIAFLEGALDDMAYQMATWGEDRQGRAVDPAVYAQMPDVAKILYPPAIKHGQGFAIATDGQVQTIPLSEVVKPSTDP